MAFFLITGGCGFIGSHLADALVAQGHRVRILDNLSTGRVENAPAAAELVVGDVTDLDAVKRCVDSVDGVFHLAAIASVEQSRRDWVGCHAVNLGGCINVFDAARQQKNPPRVVYASSAAIYGDNAAVPLAESDMPSPINAYGADKYGCELHGRVATLLHGVPTVGLRFFNIYGQRQDPRSPYSGVISIFADRLARKTPIDIYGDGLQMRDFVAVSDAVRFLLASIASAHATGEIFNVCTGHGTNIRDLAHHVGGCLGTSPEIRLQPSRPGDIRISLGDPSRATKILGVQTKLDIRQGLDVAFGDATLKVQ
jgi:UDP-glucose 4-epimerase